MSKKPFLHVVSPGALVLILMFTALMPALASGAADSPEQAPLNLAQASGVPCAERIGACSSTMMDLTAADLDGEFQYMRDAGIKWVRCTFNWNAMEKQQGVWDFSKTDPIVQKAQQYGVNVLGIIAGTPSWVSLFPTSPPALAPWKLAVWTICDRYKPGSPYGQVTAWEIWNEENFTQCFSGDAIAYAEVLKTAGEAIKMGIPENNPPLAAANPDATVVMGGLGSLNEAGNPYSILEYMGDCLERLSLYGDASDFIDAVAYHTYTVQLNSVWLPEEKYCRSLIKAVRDLAGSDLEIWITESGWSTYNISGPNFDQDTQASYDLRNVISYAGINAENSGPENMVDKIFVYCLRDKLTNDPKGVSAVGAGGKLTSTMRSLKYCEWGSLDPGITANLYGVAAGDAFNVLAVGANGTVGTLYCGALGETPSWTPYNSGTTNNLYAASCVNDIVWIVGQAGTILVGTDFFKPFTIGVITNKSQPAFGDLVGVSCVDANVTWVVGSNGVVHKTLDGGTNWSNYTLPGVSSLSAVSAVDAQTAYVVGASGIIRKTADGGLSWAVQDQPGLGNLKGVSAPSANVAYVAGSGGALLYTSNGGSTWTNNPQSTSDLYAVAAEKVTPTLAWAVGAGGKIWKTVNGGQTWYAQDSKTTNTLYAASAIDYDWNPGNAHENNYGAIGNDATGYGFVPKPKYFYLSTFEDVFGEALPVTNPYAFAVSGCGNNDQLELHAFEKADGNLAFAAWRADDVSDNQFAFTLNNTAFGSLVKIDPSSGQASPVPFTRDGNGRMAASGLTIGKVPLIIEARVGPSVTSITPNSGVQGTAVNITDLAGSGFVPGATVKLMSGDTLVEEATNVAVVSPSKITCTFPMSIQTAGTYDVVVTNPNGQMGRLPGGFTVTAAACGSGAAVAMSLFGVMMGLMSLAGAGGLRRRLRRR
jgi:photosystem II stability/assembly factor-like uncharacterized protein